MNTTLLDRNDALGIDIGNVITKGGNEMFSPDFLEAEQMPDAFESIKRLVSLFGAEKVFLVSKCGYPMQQKTKMWLNYHRFHELTGVKKDHLYFCLQRHQKKEICEKLGITVFIDDRLEILGHLSTMSPQQPKALFLFKPNEREVLRNSQFLPYVMRVESWEEVILSITLRME